MNKWPEEGNWGRWGKDDERGTLNLITPEVIKNAIFLVKRGKVVALSHPIRHGSAGVPSFPTRSAAVHLSNFHLDPDGSAGGDDYIALNTHGTTHIDSLAHFARKNTIYNGYGLDVYTPLGVTKCGIDKMGVVVTRGILIDMPKFKKVEYLKTGEPVMVEDLRQCAKSEGITFQTGDAVLVRTGFIKTYDRYNNVDFFRGSPGIHGEVLKFFDEVGTALVGTDTHAVEVFEYCPPPAMGTGALPHPVHVGALWQRGLPLMELLNLEELSASGVYEFLFMVAPLNIEMGLGSPINPLAVF